eukprot:scaffold67377_cov28-Tisochrysis_lutea.AAC.1
MHPERQRQDTVRRAHVLMQAMNGERALVIFESTAAGARCPLCLVCALALVRRQPTAFSIHNTPNVSHIHHHSHP